MPASGWGSLWESSSFVPWFSTFVFRNVPGTVSECVVICGFKRNSSNLDRAPKMRDFVLLNSWDSFLVTLPSISSETCVIYSSLILGTDVFRDWPFLGFPSCVSLVTAANFRLFLNVAIFLKGKCYAVIFFLSLFLSPFHVFNSLRHTLAMVLRGDYVATCSTAFRSATEENDSAGGHVDATCSSKVAQPNSTADWLKVLWRHQIGSDVSRT